MSQTALKYDAQVQADGRVELFVPFKPGAHVIVFIAQEPEDGLDDLVSADESSTGFWNNPFDDEDWNNA